MTYFVNVKSYEDLKAQYRALAMDNHPDQGGDLETMKAINGEYDQLFPIWKHRSADTTTETAASTRSEFYTQNGWKGENYSRDLSLKEIAVLVRQFIKTYFNDFKFSVTTEYASMCQELHVSITEGPCAAYKTRDEWTEEESDKAESDLRKLKYSFGYNDSQLEAHAAKAVYSDRVREAVEAVDAYVQSYRLDDCDGMIDYFHVNFYFFGVKIGKWDRPYKIVPKAYKAPKGSAVSTETREAPQDAPKSTTAKEYTVTPDTDTRDGSALWVVKFAERMSREEYQATAAELKKIKGYYSKFKKGFIFRYDPAEKLAEMFSRSAPADAPQADAETTQKPRKPTATTTDKERIQKQIESLQRKIEALSGEYKTNTYKRMREQQGRDDKIRGYNFDIQILVYLYGLSEQRELTALEKSLIVGAFRDELHSYYNRHKLWMDAENRPSAATPVKYPEIDPECPDGWWNKDVPKKQRRLKNAGIHNTQELHAAIAEYAEILKNATQPIDYTAQEIRQRENACRTHQKGDIQFTPDSVARRLVELSGVDEDSTVLEPSGGIGSIADRIREKTKNLDVVEMCADFRDLLKLKGHNLTGWDFLEYQPEKRYSHIIMNPPFSGNRDIEHVKHAFSLLEDGGALVAITSPHWTFANDKKSAEFRNWLDSMDYYAEDLSGGTFEMTGVHSKILVIHKDARESRETA